MEASFQLNELITCLRKAGLPEPYIREVSAELADHSVDARQATGLGDPTVLARRFVDSFRQRTFTGRHPYLVLIAGGMLLSILAFVAYHVLWIAGAMTLMSATGIPLNESATMDDVPPWMQGVLVSSLILGRCLPFVLLAAWLVRAGANVGRGYWGVAYALSGPIIAASVCSVIIAPPQSPTDKGMVSVGLGVALNAHLLWSVAVLVLAWGLTTGVRNKSFEIAT